MPRNTSRLPAWAEEMRQLFRSGTNSQFILYGGIHDLVPFENGKGEGSRREYVSLRRFLTAAMFQPFDVVIHYDRGRGIRIRKGGEHFQRFLEAFDAFQGTSWSKLPTGLGEESLELGNVLPRQATRALELINRFLRGSQSLTAAGDDGHRVAAPLKIAVLIDYAHFVAPRASSLHLSGEQSQVLIQLLDWASDPAITGAFVSTVLLTDALGDLNRALVTSPYNAKIEIDLPNEGELAEFLQDLTADEPDFERLCALGARPLAHKLVGLSRVSARSLILRALRNDQQLSHRYLTRLRKELIEKQAGGLIEFIESERSLDDVAGHIEAKAWLRQDAELLRRGVVRAVPMGYLLAGRIGTGKTFLVTCLAGEVGVPVVELKNFRDKWVGATESNLERIFTILRALGQVIVFVDEADQATGKRGGGDGDSGLSGRVYGMLAKEMSNTDNRGKVLWIFATSRPDMVEVDLKRQGRLDVHIPLFPPQDQQSRQDLFYAMARKVGLEIEPDDMPEFPDDHQIGGSQIGGNEMEGVLVRAMRLHATQGAQTGVDGKPPRPLPEILREVVKDFRPSAHVDRLVLMDLLAVKECTDARFLPKRYRDLSLAEINLRIAQLKVIVGEE